MLDSHVFPGLKRATSAAMAIAALSVPHFAAHAQPQLVSSQPLAQAPGQDEVAGYQADMRELAANIKATHPRPFRIITEEDFDALVAAEVAALGESSSKADFMWAMRRIIASIGCAHSQPPYFTQEDALISPADRFPIEVRFYDGRLWVMDGLTNADRVTRGQEIVAVNGIAVADLRDAIFSRISSDADIPNLKEPKANIYATSYLTYATGFPGEYEITLRGSTEPIALSPLEEYQFQPIVSPLAACQEELCYEVDEARNVGIATLRSLDYYGGERAERFVEWFAGVIDDLSENNRDGVLLDFRGVEGGSGTAGSYMLRHFADRPFPYWSANSDPRGRADLFDIQQPIENDFDGRVYVLTDGLTVSALPHLFAVAQANDIATLIGAPAGGGKSTNDGKIAFASSHAKFEYLIARMIFEVEAPQLSTEQAVQPDIHLEYSLSDVLNRTDSMRQRAITLLGVAAADSRKSANDPKPAGPVH